MKNQVELEVIWNWSISFHDGSNLIKNALIYLLINALAKMPGKH